MKKVGKYIVFYILFVVYHIGFTLIFTSVKLHYVETLMYYLLQSIFIFLFYKCLSINKMYKLNIKNIFYICIHYIFYLFFFYCYYYKIFNTIFKDYFPVMSFREFVYFLSEIYFQLMPFGILYWFYSKSSLIQKMKLQKEKENNNLILKNLQLQIQNEQLTKQKIEADYNYLRTQINPHFLYNTLGYFYSKVAPVQPQTAEGILMLTNIMRYSLYQGDELGKVPLKMEIDNLDNYIGLQKMRFGNNLYLEYEKNIDPENEYKILPHLLITLVENAFKHGNYTKHNHPLNVSIALLGNKLVVKVENLINKAVSEMPSTKTGLQNMQNRLKLVYGNKQKIEIANDGNLFSIWMQIELDDLIDKIAKESPQSNEAVLNAKPENPNPFYKVAIL